ncbi:hypothetical protein S83_038501 [Arachis hypogaea]
MGNQKQILKDPQFAPFLTSRSKINLKDKWLNLSVSNGTQGSKEKFRIPRIRLRPCCVTPVATDATRVTTMIHQPDPDPSVTVGDPLKMTKMLRILWEAMSTLKDAKSDLNVIVNFIEIELRKPHLSLVGNAKTVVETLNKEIKDDPFCLARNHPWVEAIWKKSKDNAAKMEN